MKLLPHFFRFFKRSKKLTRIQRLLDIIYYLWKLETSCKILIIHRTGEHGNLYFTLSLMPLGKVSNAFKNANPSIIGMRISNNTKSGTSPFC